MKSWGGQDAQQQAESRIKQIQLTLTESAHVANNLCSERSAVGLERARAPTQSAFANSSVTVRQQAGVSDKMCPKIHIVRPAH